MRVPKNWAPIYDALIQLLRSLSKAKIKSIPADGPVVTALFRETLTNIETCVEGYRSAASETVQELNILLTATK